MVASSRITQANLEGRSLVILNDAAINSNVAGWLRTYVERGGGLWLVLGSRTPASGDWPLVPGTLGSPVDRLASRGGTLGYLDYSHPVFDEYKDPRNGNFANMRFIRYRSLVPGEGDRVLARFDDGGTAMVERRVGAGRVVAMTSTVDESWNNVATQPMFVPLVHELAGYLAQYETPASSQTVGRMFDLSAAVGSAVREGSAAASGASFSRGVVVSHTNDRRRGRRAHDAARRAGVLLGAPAGPGRPPAVRRRRQYRSR
jgi:hypothetical protein